MSQICIPLGHTSEAATEVTLPSFLRKMVLVSLFLSTIEKREDYVNRYICLALPHGYNIGV